MNCSHSRGEETRLLRCYFVHRPQQQSAIQLHRMQIMATPSRPKVLTFFVILFTSFLLKSKQTIDNYWFIGLFADSRIIAKLDNESPSIKIRYLRGSPPTRLNRTVCVSRIFLMRCFASKKNRRASFVVQKGLSQNHRRRFSAFTVQ